MSLTLPAAECSSSALFARPELVIAARPDPAETLEAPIEWTRLPSEHHRRPVARLATSAPGSDAESGLIELGPWPGGVAANGPGPAPLRPAILLPPDSLLAPSARRDASVSGSRSSGSLVGPWGRRGMDPIGLALLAASFVSLTVVAGLLAYALG